MILNDTIGAIVGLVITLLVFSYLIGDNPLYRFALHVFVGASIAYAVVVAWHAILRPLLLDWVLSGNVLLGLVPFLLGGLLLARGVRSLSWLGSLSIALLLGVGAAVAVGGALVGTLLPQAGAAMRSLSPLSYPDDPLNGPLDGLLIVVGTVTSLMVFTFTLRRGMSGRLIALGTRLGRFFLFISFGAVFAGVLIASVSVLVERLQFIIETVERLAGV